MVALDADAEARAATTFEATEELLDETLVVARADYAILWTFRPAATEDEKDMLTCGAYRSVGARPRLARRFARDGRARARPSPCRLARPSLRPRARAPRPQTAC